MDIKELKGYIKVILGGLVISAVILYSTCFFNRCNLIEATQREETSPYLWMAAFVMLGAVSLLVVRLLSERVKLPSVPGDWQNEQLKIYRYNGMAYIGLLLLCLGMGLFMLVGAIINLASGVWDGGVALLFEGGCFTILGVVFWLYITRCVLIFYPGGLLYRNLRGEVYVVADEDVLCVMPLGFGKNRCFRLKTKDRTITWLIHARDFFEAERYALERYPDWESYERQKNSGVKANVKRVENREISIQDETTYSVELTAIGNDEVAVIKTYRDMTGLGIKEARDKVVVAPCILLETDNREEAEGYKTALEDCGATVHILECKKFSIRR